MAEAVHGETLGEEPLVQLFREAFKAAPFDFVCTLLRVGGYEMADWDPFEESRNALADYDWLLQQIRARGEEAARRVSLLIYCHAVEMSAVHDMLANLIRCKSGTGFRYAPLGGLGRRRRKKPRGLDVFLDYVPPSAKQKFAKLTAMARAANCEPLSDAIGRVFNDRVRNAFVHSDYVLTASGFRSREGHLAQEMRVEELDAVIAEGFRFYGTFLSLCEEWKLAVGKGRRFHKLPRYEVLELLSSEYDGLYGFSVHFSNGEKATWMRRRETGTVGSQNIMVDAEGVAFRVRDLDAPEPVWKIDGEPVTDWDALP
jgi:hypothetical protein